MTKRIKASELQPGTVIEVTGERFAVERVQVKWGAVQVANHIGWRGLGLDESVQVLGYFNP